MAATIFANVRIIDGSGVPPFSGEVRVEGNRITALARDGGRCRARVPASSTAPAPR